MVEEIQHILDEMEMESGFRVLFAVESGSRAWGFPSPDSDYDVRFVFGMPRDYYLRLNEEKDTIDRMAPNEIDLGGWDLRKAMRLFGEGNVAIYEWLQSPILYREESAVMERWRARIPLNFNARKTTHHYLRMATNVAEEWFGADAIPIKRLFYMARASYAARWCVLRESMPPTFFPDMLGKGIGPESLDTWLGDRMREKATLPEKAPVCLGEEQRNWFHETLESLRRNVDSIPIGQRLGWEDLNGFFRETLATLNPD